MEMEDVLGGKSNAATATSMWGRLFGSPSVAGPAASDATINVFSVASGSLDCDLC